MKVDYTEEQRAYFARLNHAERFRWQVDDSFVRRHEQEVLKPLVQEILQLAELGSVSVLESGCGEGVNLVHLNQMIAGDRPPVQFTGIDMSPEAISIARKHGLTVEIGDGLHLPYQDHSFEIVFCRDVLHHLADDAMRRQFFAEMRRVVKTGGRVIVMEPNPRNAGIWMLSHLIPAERGLREIGEERLRHLLSGTRAIPVAPSSVWRALYHYRSPFFRFSFLAAPTRFLLTLWDWVCWRGPRCMWSYRVYVLRV